VRFQVSPKFIIIIHILGTLDSSFLFEDDEFIDLEVCDKVVNLAESSTLRVLYYSFDLVCNGEVF
jgi:hypothetical protein